jgi:hypothetical protein
MYRSLHWNAYCCAASIPAIDVLKIDTEDNELNVLKGSQAMAAGATGIKIGR